MKTQIAIFTLGLALAGCGGWKQDPLAGKKGDFGDAKINPTKPDFSKPLDSRAVRIQLPDFQSFQEGVTTEFPISARVLLEGYTAEVQVVNLADFPGAKFENGVFRWTPAVGYADVLGPNGTKTQTLIVRAYGYKPNDQVLAADAERPMYISREFQLPEIVSATKPEDFIREGNTLTIPVDVFDRDAVESDSSTWPQVIMQPIPGAKSLGGLTTASRVQSTGNQHYLALLFVDTREVELTDSVDTYQMKMVVASRFGKISQARSVNLDVYTSFTTPNTTWTETLVAKEEEAITHKFLISDPKLEAWLKLANLFSMPTGSDMTCTPTARGMLNCVFTWTPAVGQAGDYPLSAYIQSRNNDARDTSTPLKTLNFNVQVLPKGS